MSVNRNRALKIVLLFISLLVLIFTLYDYYNYKAERKNKALTVIKENNNIIRGKINKTLDSVIDITNSLSNDISNSKYSKKELYSKLKETSGKSPICYGIAIAYKPYQYDPSTKFLAPYYFNNKVIDISEIYDYTDESLKTNLWYTEVIKKEKGVWSEPYYGETSNNLVVDYSTPFYRINPDGSKEVIGVVDFVISLEEFSEYIKEISTGISGFGFLATKNLNLVTHPKTEFLTRPGFIKDIIEQQPEFLRIKTEEEGSIDFKSRYTSVESKIYFLTLNNNWVFSTVFIASDVLGLDVKQDPKLIHISLALSVLLLLVFIVSFNIKETRKLWYFSIMFSILVLLNISLIWYIKLSLNVERKGNINIGINDTDQLNRYINNRNVELKKIGQEPSVLIPTGIFISDIDFKGAYEASFRGKIWQKIPDTLELSDDINFDFVQKYSSGISVRTQLESKIHVNDYWLYRYNFTSILQFDLSYHEYPLDTRLLNIQLMYPDVQANRILVPDVVSYKILNPKLKPGIDKGVFLPGEDIISSYFSFAAIDYNSNLGNENYKGTSDIPILEFNILIKRKILNTLIGNILPIFVIAIMMFLLTFTLIKKDEKLVEGSALSIIQAAGGFFFILLLAHIQLRTGLTTPDLSYLESFYFIMYVMIALVSTSSLLYAKTNKYEILQFKNNIFVKLAFWPSLLLLIFIMTLIRFYN